MREYLLLNLIQLTDSVRPAGQQTPGILLSPHLWHWETCSTHHHTCILAGCWTYELKSFIPWNFPQPNKCFSAIEWLSNAVLLNSNPYKLRLAIYPPSLWKMNVNNIFPRNFPKKQIFPKNQCCYKTQESHLWWTKMAETQRLALGNNSLKPEVLFNKELLSPHLEAFETVAGHGKAAEG